MHSDYLEIRKNFLSHASMAGMPSNLRTADKRAKEGRRLAYKNYDRVTGGDMTKLILEEDALAKKWASGKISDSDALRMLQEITAKGFVAGFNSTAGKKNPMAIYNTLMRSQTGGNNYANVVSEADAERIRKFEARMNTIASTGRKDIYRSAGSKAGMPSNIPIRHASMAGMPTNVARKMGFRQVTGPSTKYYSDKVNNLKVKADEANKKVEEVVLEMMSVTGDISGGKIKYALSKAKSAIQKFTKEAIPLMVEAMKAEDAYYEAIEQRNKSVLNDFDDKKSEAERWMSNVKGKMQK